MDLLVNVPVSVRLYQPSQNLKDKVENKKLQNGLQTCSTFGATREVRLTILLTGCKGRTRKYKPKIFLTARACEGCLENQGLVFPGTARAPS